MTGTKVHDERSGNQKQTAIVRAWFSLKRVILNPTVAIAVTAASQLGFLSLALQGEVDLPMIGALLAGMLLGQLPLLIAVVILIFRMILIFPEPRPAARAVSAATVISIGLNLVLPARLSEIPRLAYLRHRANVAVSKALAAILLEKMSDIAAILLLISGLLAAGILTVEPEMQRRIALAAFVAVALICSALAMRNRIVRAISRLGLERFADFIRHFSESVATVITKPVFYASAVIALLSFATVSAGYFILLRFAVPDQTTWQLALMVFAATTIGGSISGLPGGAVGFQGAAMIILASAGVSTSLAAATAVAIHLQQYLVLTPLSILLVRRSGLSLPELVWRGPQKKNTGSVDHPGRYQRHDGTA